MESVIEPVPLVKLEPDDLKSVIAELDNYHAIYSPLFRRREQRENAHVYLRGLLSSLDRKSVEPIVLEHVGVDRAAIRSLQSFLSEGAWKDAPILERHWQEVDHVLGEPEGVLVVDGSDFPKQGKASVGVKRQYCGQLGKTANCQAGVFAGYVSSKGYTLLHRRLFLPQEWLQDEAFAQRRDACGIPESIRFETKPTLALRLVQEIVRSGQLRCRWMAADEAFGQVPAFLDGVASEGLWYFAEVPHVTRMWLQRPAVEIPAWKGRGRKPTHLRVAASAPAPQTVAEMAEQVSHWQREVIKEGSQGPQVAEFARMRVVTLRDELPGPEVWLVLRRHLDTGELKAYLSNAPTDIPLPTLARLSGMRWPIETCFEDAKQLLGMGHYEGRSWTGWHHHMTLVILAHFFVVRTMLTLKKKSSLDASANRAASAGRVAALHL